MRSRQTIDSTAILFLGAFSPDKPEYKNKATSTAGNIFQLDFLAALAESPLENPTVYSYFPIESFPGVRSLFVGSRTETLSNGLVVRSLPHINIGVIKILTLGVFAAGRTFAWGLRHREASQRVVITYNLTAPPAWPIALVCRALRLKMVPFIGDINVPGEIVDNGLFRRLEFAVQKALIPRMDGLLIANEDIVRDFAPNSHSLLFYGGASEKLVRRFESVSRGPSQEFHIVYAGQLSILNGVTLLLDALKLIEMPNLRVTIMGGGEFQSAVEEAATQDKRINFLGLCPREEVLTQYETADLLVNLRRTELRTQRYVFPSKVAECLGTGRPLLTTRVGRLDKDHENAQFFLPEETPEALAQEITRIAAMPVEEREARGKAAREYVLESRTWESNVRQLSQYLQSKVFASQPRLRVMACVDYYLPGFKGGGPAVSVSRIVGNLASEVDFAVFTRDRDLGDNQPYPSIQVGEWFRSNDVDYFYAGPSQINLGGLLRAIRTAKPDIIYLNSYFSKITRTVLLLRLLGRLRGISLLVAPRGEFSPGALGLKSAKKRTYLKLAGLSHIHHGLTWHVSSEHEMRDTCAAVDANVKCFVKPPDLFAPCTVELQKPPKHAGEAAFAFISRISPKKNLLGAIEMLARVSGKARLTIYGPIEDSEYWSRCEASIATLPPGITCEYAGPIAPSEVLPKLGAHHFFLFPTLGENFGHVIPEALNAGCPVLLSDQTPWLDLEEKKAGWVMPLDSMDAWTRTIQACIDMDAGTYATFAHGAQQYVRDLAESSTGVQEGLRMFETARRAA